MDVAITRKSDGVVEFFHVGDSEADAVTRSGKDPVDYEGHDATGLDPSLPYMWDGNNLVLDLTPYKVARVTRMSVSLKAYIYSKYDSETQSSLEALYSRALNGGGKPNRAAHIAAAIDWLDSVLTSFYSKKSTILAAADQAAVDAVTWDWPTDFDASDPAVTIESAMAITT